MLPEVLLEPWRDDVIGSPQVHPPHEILCLDRDTIIVRGIGVKPKEYGFVVLAISPLLSHSGNHFTGFGMQLDQTNLYVVVKLAPEGIVGVGSKRSDGGREGGNKIPESPPFLGRRVANLRLFHTVLPNKVGWQIRFGLELEIVAHLLTRLHAAENLLVPSTDPSRLVLVERTILVAIVFLFDGSHLFGQPISDVTIVIGVPGIEVGFRGLVFVELLASSGTQHDD